jgi:hypothetical protein
LARLAIRLLGSFQATADGEPVTGFETVKARALLAYLAVESDRPHRRELLAEMLWPERPIGAARANLRHTLPGRLVCSGGICGNLSTTIRVVDGILDMRTAIGSND